MTTENKKTWKTLGILSIVSGVTGVLLSFTGSIGFYLSILGLLLGIGSIITVTKQEGKMVLAIIGIALSLLGSYWGYSAMQVWKAATEDFQELLEEDNLLESFENLETTEE